MLPAGETLPLSVELRRQLRHRRTQLVRLSWLAALALLLSVVLDAPLGAVGTQEALPEPTYMRKCALQWHDQWPDVGDAPDTWRRVQ